MCVTLAVAGTLGVGVLMGIGAVALGTGLQVLASMAVLYAVAVMSWQLRRSHRHGHHLQQRMDQQVVELAEVAGENRAELFTRAEEISARLTQLEKLMTTHGGSEEQVSVRIEGAAEKNTRVTS